MCDGKTSYVNLEKLNPPEKLLSEEAKALGIYYADTLRDILAELRKMNNSLVAIRKELRIRSDDGK